MQGSKRSERRPNREEKAAGRPPAESVAGVETGAMEGGGWNPESCPRYTAKSIYYIELAHY